jgi:hypothetical protein
MDEKKTRRNDDVGLESGPGALCSEAQADGVPCTELGRECERCERAAGRERPPKGKDRA